MAPVKLLASLAATSTLVAAAPHLAARQAASVPQYVLDNAPLVKITSGDPWLPSDISNQLANTHPQINSTDIDASAYPSPLTLDNLDALNSVPNANGGSFVYLASTPDFSTRPAPQYLLGVAPDASGTTQGAVSAVVIVYDHGDGTVDGFYHYFYAYNQGNNVFGNELGDHIGDWEHNMIRFTNGTPSQVWYSQHDNGEAFEWDAAGLPKQGNRLIAYSANGTHANYASAGTHDHTIPDFPLPEGLLVDTTDDDGYLWDPLLSAYFYTVTFPAGTAAGDSSSPTFAPANNGVSAGSAPTAYLNFKGQWGDNQLPSSDSRQSEFFGFYKYTGGPTGPADKQLNRKQVCPDNGKACIVRTSVPSGG